MAEWTAELVSLDSAEVVAVARGVVDGSTVTVWLSCERAARLRLTDLELSVGDDESITATMLRAVPVGALLSRVSGLLTDVDMAARDESTYEPWQRLTRALIHGPTRTGESTDTKYARVAAVYALLVESGEPAPAVRLAEIHGITVNTAHAWLTRARDRGLLTRPGAGRPGGDLTDRAKQLLSDRTEPANGESEV